MICLTFISLRQEQEVTLTSLHSAPFVILNNAQIRFKGKTQIVESFLLFIHFERQLFFTFVRNNRLNESQIAQIAITKEFFFVIDCDDCDLFLFTARQGRQEVYFSHCYQICIHILRYIFGFYKYYFEALSYNLIRKKIQRK